MFRHIKNIIAYFIALIVYDSKVVRSCKAKTTSGCGVNKNKLELFFNNICMICFTSLIAIILIYAFVVAVVLTYGYLCGEPIDISQLYSKSFCVYLYIHTAITAISAVMLGVVSD